MVLLLPLLTWGGVASCSVGALLALVGVAKGRQARQLSTAVQVDSLAGKGSRRKDRRCLLVRCRRGLPYPCSRAHFPCPHHCNALLRHSLSNLTEMKQLWALVPILIAVTGRVLAPKPYRCEMSENEAAIVEVGRSSVLVVVCNCGACRNLAARCWRMKPPLGGGVPCNSLQLCQSRCGGGVQPCPDGCMQLLEPIILVGAGLWLPVWSG